MTKEERLQQWQKDYEAFLKTVGIASLRAIGRHVGVPQATARKKGELTAYILSIADGRVSPVEKSKRGAPIKEDFVDPALLERLEEFLFRRASIEAEYSSADPIERKTARDVFAPVEGDELVVRSADGENAADRVVYVGDISAFCDAYCVNIVEPKEDFGKKAVLSSAAFSRLGLRVGDRLTFYAAKRFGFLEASEVLTVNALHGAQLNAFNRAEAVYPYERLFSAHADRSSLFNYFSTVYPIARGQRVLLQGGARSGKSRLLREVAAALLAEDADSKVVVDLCDRSPEEIGEWRRTLPHAEIYSSDYCDEAEDHLLQAEKALERAKSYVCEGKKVALLLDDVNALARSFNESGYAAGGKTLEGGLESKTLYYAKRYLGSAKQLSSGASLTVFAVTSYTESDGSFDGVLLRELSRLSSACWAIGAEGGKARPNAARSHALHTDAFLSEKETSSLAAISSVDAEKTYAFVEEQKNVCSSEELLKALSEKFV